MINISFEDKFEKKENFPNFVKRNKIMFKPQWKPVNVKSKYDNTIWPAVRISVGR